MKGFSAVLLSITLVVAVADSPLAAARRNPGARSPETASDVSDLRLPDPHQELRHLSKNLKLKRDQRVGVGMILQERTREIRLLLDIEDIELVSQEYRNTLAAKVIQDSNAQIETLLRSKQKRKFDKELATDRETR